MRGGGAHVDVDERYFRTHRTPPRAKRVCSAKCVFGKLCVQQSMQHICSITRFPARQQVGVGQSASARHRLPLPELVQMSKVRACVFSSACVRQTGPSKLSKTHVRSQDFHRVYKSMSVSLRRPGIACHCQSTFPRARCDHDFPNTAEMRFRDAWLGARGRPW